MHHHHQQSGFNSFEFDSEELEGFFSFASLYHNETSNIVMHVTIFTIELVELNTHKKLIS